MGVAILVLEILLLSKTAIFPFPTMDYKSMVIKKFNHLELAQKIHASRGQCIKKFNHMESAKKIHASRGSCHMHAHQF